jgi:hypothetical protein
MKLTTFGKGEPGANFREAPLYIELVGTEHTYR